MDVHQWKHILFDWIKATELIDIFGTLDHINLEEYFFKFYLKIRPECKDSTNLISIIAFLQEICPAFEIVYDERNQISSQDYIYVFSILLHYSCVEEKNEYFQNACSKLTSKYQLCVAKFLGYVNESTFTKEHICTGIKNAVQCLSPLETMYFSLSSPLRTPKKSEISPSTPTKDFINTKLKELKVVKSVLENEQFEKNMIEIELKQSQEKVVNLVKKCSDLSLEVKKLKLSKELDESDPENVSPNKAQKYTQVRRKMQKEVQHREDLISDLKLDIENSNATNAKNREQINSMKKQMNEMRLKIRELEACIEELQCNVNLKDNKIFNLEEERKELLEFINETRSASANGKDISSDCLDFSGGSSLYTTSCSDFGESLAKSVIDVQLKEKENEIIKLNELLSSTKKTTNEMEVKISDLSEAAKNLKIDLNETKLSKAKLFEEKSREIQLLKNDLNSSLLKMRELQHELDFKQSVYHNLLTESDGNKLELENLKLKYGEMKQQLEKRDEEISEIENKFKNEKEINEKEQEALKCKLSSSMSIADAGTQKIFETIEHKLRAKDDQIVRVSAQVKELCTKYHHIIKDYQAKLALKDEEIVEVKKNILEVKNNLKRENDYNDQVAQNNEVLRAKLEHERRDKIEIKKNYQEEIENLSKDKKKYHVEMQEKLSGYKSSMIEKYNKLIADSQMKEVRLNEEQKSQLKEKDEIIKQNDCMLQKCQDENEKLGIHLADRNRKMDDLSMELKEVKRENEFLQSKLRFFEKNSSAAPDVSAENFDNAFLKDLKNGTGFGHFSTCSASIFQERNSKYPIHMRDSYSVCAIDKNVSEHDMKNGFVKPADFDPPSPISDNQRKRKQGVTYHKPGPPTPSKNGRYSSSHSELKALKDASNTENAEKKQTFLKGLKGLSSTLRTSFSRPKMESIGKRLEKNIRSLTPKTLNSHRDRWIVEKDTDSDGTVKCPRKMKELDRRVRRDRARDQNRPNLNRDFDDECSICFDDADWMDDGDFTEEETLTQHDKSLEYIKIRDLHRKRQQKMRRRSHNDNRRCSIKNNCRMSTEDWEKYKSCASLASESSFVLCTPKKSCIRNFIDSHIAEVNRMSDVYVESKSRLISYSNKTDDFWNFNFKDVQKPFPLIVIVILTICLTASIIRGDNDMLYSGNQTLNFI